MKTIVFCSHNSSLHLSYGGSRVRAAVVPSGLLRRSSYFTLQCFRSSFVLHLDANDHRFASPPDLSSTLIPVDDDEEDEETYDDIEGATNPLPLRPGSAPAPQRGKSGGGQEMGEEVDDEYDDTYELLPGMGRWLGAPHKDR